MTNLTDNILQSKKNGTYRVKWFIGKPIGRWEQSELILDGEGAVNLFKEKINTCSQVILIEEKALARFASAIG